jgi:hypothetical protein
MGTEGKQLSNRRIGERSETHVFAFRSGYIRVQAEITRFEAQRILRLLVVIPYAF